MALILMYVGLAAAVFLLVLNGHLRRPHKILIDVMLGLFWLAIVGSGFFLIGWKIGVAFVLVSLFCAVLFKPVAAQWGRRTLGRWTTFRPPLSASRDDLSDEAMRAHHKETERRIDPIAQRPGITKLLAKHGMRAETLREQFHFLVDNGLGIVAREIISNSRDLDRLLDMRRRQLPPEKIAARLMRWR